MATVVDALLVTLGVDSSGVDRGMNQAQERINSGVKNIVSALSAPIMAALAGFSAGAAVSAYTATATSLDRLSQSLGMSMESLQGWQFAAEAAGAEAAEVGNLFRDMSDLIVDANTFDGGALKDIAKELGLDLKDAQGGMRATEDVILDLADAFQRVGEQKAVAFGMQLGLDPGIIAMMQKGSASIETLIAKQKELGGYTKEDAELALEARYSFLVMGKAIEAATRPIIREILPALRWLSDGITEFSQKIKEHSQFIKVALGTVSVFMTARLVPAIEKMIKTHDKAIKAFAPWAAVLMGVALLIDDLVAYVHGGDSALAGFWAQFGTGEEILAFFKSTWEAVLAGLEKMKPLIPALLKFGAVVGVFSAGMAVFRGVASTVMGVSSAFRALRVVLATNPLRALLLAASLLIVYWDDIIAATERVGAFIGEVFTAAGDMFRQAFNDMLVVADAVGGGISATFDMLTGGISSAVSSAMAAVTSAFTSAKETVQSVWEGVFNWFKEKFKWLMDAWNGLSALPGKIGNAVSDVGKSIADGAKGAFDKVGEWGAGLADWAGFGSDEKKAAAAEAIPGAAYNSAINNRTANITKTTTINGGINITGASDPQASGKAVSEAIRDNDDDLSFAVDTGVRQ